MTHTPGPHRPDGSPAMPAPTRLRDQLLRDLLGDCLPMAHIESVIAHECSPASVAARQELVMGAIRSLLEDGLIVVGDIVGGSDERVEPWGVSPDDAMARIHDRYIVHHDDPGRWVFNAWFALTDSGEQAAKALEGHAAD